MVAIRTRARNRGEDLREGEDLADGQNRSLRAGHQPHRRRGNDHRHPLRVDAGCAVSAYQAVSAAGRAFSIAASSAEATNGLVR